MLVRSWIPSSTILILCGCLSLAILQASLPNFSSCEQVCGVHHLETMETRTHLIALLHALGQHGEAIQLEVAQPELLQVGL